MISNFSALGVAEGQAQTDLISPSFLAPIVRKLLESSPDKRFSSCYFVLEDINRHLVESPLDLDCPPSVVAMIQSVPFVSASRLMSQLTPVQEWFNRARSAGTLIVEITGLPGSGKKRAAETLLLYFKLRGLKVLRTHIESASRPGGTTCSGSGPIPTHWRRRSTTWSAPC